MSMELTGLCVDHSFESATAICRRCGQEFCDNCLVFPFGEKKPLCKDCAMMIAGVKSQARRPEMASRFVRRRAKEFAKAVTSASAPMPEPEVPAIVDTTEVDPAEVPEPEFEYAPAGHVEPPTPDASAPPPPPPSQPAEGVAPAVDWNNPFG
ncbi:MAG: hypothetical protein AAGA90_20360 [Actinomycetota bacterium]